MGDGGEPYEVLGGRSHERRGIVTEKRTEILSSLVCVGVNGESPGVPGITRPPREKGNGTGQSVRSWARPKNPNLIPYCKDRHDIGSARGVEGRH